MSKPLTITALAASLLRVHGGASLALSFTPSHGWRASILPDPFDLNGPFTRSLKGAPPATDPTLQADAIAARRAEWERAPIAAGAGPTAEVALARMERLTHPADAWPA